MRSAGTPTPREYVSVQQVLRVRIVELRGTAQPSRRFIVVALDTKSIPICQRKIPFSSRIVLPCREQIQLEGVGGILGHANTARVEISEAHLRRSKPFVHSLLIPIGARRRIGRQTVALHKEQGEIGFR